METEISIFDKLTNHKLLSKDGAKVKEWLLDKSGAQKSD